MTRDYDETIEEANAKNLQDLFLVPTLRVGMPGAALRAANETQERLDLHSTLSMERAIEKCEGTNAKIPGEPPKI